MNIVNAAAYKFVELDDLQNLRSELQSRSNALGLKGTVLLAPEGINLFIAGTRGGIDGFKAFVLADPRFADVSFKESFSEEQPFNRMLVKVKREIIPFAVPEVTPAQNPAPRVSALQLKRWLDEGRPLLLLDARNDFEVELGTFRGARQLGLESFRQFPDAARQLSSEDRPIVTFCTGGIRCEKAAALLLQRGFREVYQLDGGILRYFEEVGGDHFDGECFVFDKRVAVDAKLQPTGTTQCYVCQSVLSVVDQRSADYVPNVACPYCERKHGNRATTSP
jgi:UPF0176 protein